MGREPRFQPVGEGPVLERGPRIVLRDAIEVTTGGALVLGVF